MIRRRFGRLWRSLPIVGGLPFSTKLAHKEASKEICLTVVFAGLPLLLPILLALMIPPLHTSNAFNRLVGEGELYLYASAFVGPLIYAVFKQKSADGVDSNDKPITSKVAELTGTALRQIEQSDNSFISPISQDDDIASSDAIADEADKFERDQGDLAFEGPIKPTVGFLFPDGIWFVLVSFLIVAVCLVAMIFLKIVPIEEPLLIAARPALRSVSFVVFALSVLCLYSASVYRNDLEKADNAMRSGERDFAAQWRAR